MAKMRISLALYPGFTSVLEELKGKTEFEAARRIKAFGTKRFPVTVVIEGRDPDGDLNVFNGNRVKLVVTNGFVIRADIG